MSKFVSGSWEQKAVLHGMRVDAVLKGFDYLVSLHQEDAKIVENSRKGLTKWIRSNTQTAYYTSTEKKRFQLFIELLEFYEKRVQPEVEEWGFISLYSLARRHLQLLHLPNWSDKGKDYIEGSWKEDGNVLAEKDISKMIRNNDWVYPYLPNSTLDDFDLEGEATIAENQAVFLIDGLKGGMELVCMPLSNALRHMREWAEGGMGGWRGDLGFTIRMMDIEEDAWERLYPKKIGFQSSLTSVSMPFLKIKNPSEAQSIAPKQDGFEMTLEEILAPSSTDFEEIPPLKFPANDVYVLVRIDKVKSLGLLNWVEGVVK